MKIILVSHGYFSKGLLESVQMILGEQENLTAHCLMPEETPAALSQRLEAEIRETEGDDILFLTDLYHGSPFNVVVSLMKDYKFRHITGINMPLLIDAIMSRNGGLSIQEICSRLVKQAPGTILDVDDLLKKEDMEE
ncbi:PTS sugar transporter subunit IIA [Lacrimispora indolis]|uniref:PTS sugar transporter subunit IIA n=1 Tax=Lacrimispora indolis TaxID=69825 RepID=UPI0004287350|nr:MULTISPECIES: PTS sugar transporter subunit IIA [Lachnospiraceae]MBE7722355.1 PTS sugar transporter subunit IIA [Lacrimispora celerecrescens]